MKTIDLRSDTVTLPTAEMREAMAAAEVGDDVYGDDPTVNRLEELAARILGKEAALFVPSGTMGNQLCIMTHTRPGNEIIAGAASHIVSHEAGAAARLSGVAYALADNPDQVIRAADVRRLVRPGGNVHYPRTALLCLENALGSGDVVPPAELRAAFETARELGLKVHLDGARIFNAALALGVSAADIAACADSVMFCVSKGLCAPVGSLVCGQAEFVERARYNRKILGGGMRQAGVLAACGIIALEKMTRRLGTDHENARLLGEALAAIPGVQVDREKIRINMVFWKTAIPGFDDGAFTAFMRERHIKIGGASAGEYRFVTHNGVSREDIGTVAAALRDYTGGLAG
ncbi:MAG: low specificity L-threonine aldolase [Treponema sp.]|jgi:threonine aldolase|nr:low specificity L-threonine aldolase [Treponema sp.]